MMEIFRVYSSEAIERVRSNLGEVASCQDEYFKFADWWLRQHKHTDPTLQRVENIFNKYSLAYNTGIVIGIDMRAREDSDTNYGTKAYLQFLNDIRSGTLRVFNLQKEEEINDLINGIERTCRAFATARLIKDLEEAFK